MASRERRKLIVRMESQEPNKGSVSRRRTWSALSMLLTSCTCRDQKPPLGLASWRLLVVWTIGKLMSG